MDLVDELIKKLAAANYKLATAESCTGGLIASAVTSKPGASKVFERGFVTYSNDAKAEMLGVDLKSIEKQGAVSTLVADAMVKGALEHSKADIAVSVTGIAGPDGGSEKKPVGLVYIGYALKNNLVKVAQFNFEGGREEIRLQAVKQALKLALSLLD